MTRSKSWRKVWLIHWNAEEAAALAGTLTRAGYDVVGGARWSSPIVRRLKDDPPSAVIIDLSRLPSQGRDVAFLIRSYKSMLGVPMVLVAGSADAVARIRARIPDAAHTSWSRIRSALRRAIAKPPRDAVRQSVFAAYAETPLLSKLGIKPNFVVTAVNAPDELEQILGELPDGARLRCNTDGPRDLTLWFVRSRDELARRMEEMKAHAAGGRLWIVWRKRVSGGDDDLSQVTVRRAGLDSGLVDFKVSRIDETWAGLLFTKRR